MDLLACSVGAIGAARAFGLAALTALLPVGLAEVDALRGG